jgi:hypothetical protein
MDVSIIVSNRNGRSFLRDCLLSLRGAGRPACEFEILVADNGSTDGSVEMVRREFPEAQILSFGEDLGYTRSNNKAIAQCSGRYVELLNNDTIVLPGAIDRLVEFMDATPGAGGVGNRLVYPDGREQYSGRRFPTGRNAVFGRRSLLTRWFPDNRWSRAYLYADDLRRDEPFEVDWISHAGALYRREVLADAGGLDESLYYWHEASLALELHRLGRKIYLHPKARMVHYEGLGSGSRTLADRVRHHLDFARGSHRFHCRHRGLGPRDPRRLLAGAGLAARVVALSLGELLRRSPRGPDREAHVESAYSRLLQILLSREGEAPTILFTAVGEGEGVSSVIATLGQELALRGRAETLLVDANFHQPGLHEIFLVENGPGFSEMLALGESDVDGRVRPICAGLSLVTHGRSPFEVAHPRGQQAFQESLARLAALRRFTLVDAAPVDRRPDALAMAPCVDAVVLVVRAERASCEAVQRAVAELRRAGGNVLGAIYNGKPLHIPEAVYRRL